MADIPIEPFVRGFKGSVIQDGKEIHLRGIWKVEKDVMTISELPAETWSTDYKEWLENQVTNGIIKDYTDISTDTVVNVQIKLTGNPDHRAVIEKSLQTKLRTTNMHAFNSDGAIQKYDTLFELLEEFALLRLDLYKKRREHMLSEYRKKLPYHKNIVRFITQQCEVIPRPDLRRKTTEECEQLLTQEGFSADIHNQLLDLPIRSLTLAKAQKHREELEALESRITELDLKTSEQLWLDDLDAWFHFQISKAM